MDRSSVFCQDYPVLLIDVVEGFCRGDVSDVRQLAEVKTCEGAWQKKRRNGENITSKYSNQAFIDLPDRIKYLITGVQPK